MTRILTLMTLAALAACTTGAALETAAGPPSDAAADASSAAAAADVPAADAATPTQWAAPPAPLLVSIAPHTTLQETVITQPQPTAVVKAALEQAVQGLLYTSESDYPFQVFVLPGAGQPHVTAYNVKQKLAAIYVQRPETLPLAQRKVQSETLAGLFKNYVHAQDWWGDFEKARAPGFKTLKQIIESQLSYVHVYRIGPKTPWGLSPDIDVFILGTSAGGDVVGLWTVSIET